MATPAYEDALDELYGADLADFVPTRKRLTADLRAGGDRDAAKELMAQRRPSTAAWALNQLARRDPELVAEFLERSGALVAAQTHARSGAADALRTAIQEHRRALDAATDAALAVLGPRAGAGFRDEIVSTLRAASSDVQTAALLQSGRVIREVSAVGFPESVGLRLVPEPREPEPREPRPRTATREREREGERAEHAEREREERRREDEARRAAERAAHEDALERARAADAETARLRERVGALEGELAAAKRELRAAQAASRAATADATRLAPRDRIR